MAGGPRTEPSSDSSPADRTPPRGVFTTSLHGNDAREVVQLPGIAPDLIRDLIGYMYLRHLVVDDSNVYQLLVTADFLGILGVLDICCAYLERKLSPTNCVGILVFARRHFCRDLAEAAWRYIMKNFAQIATQSEEILELPLEELKQIINDDELNVKSEEIVWEAILRW